jgi:hypothetical protein
MPPERPLIPLLPFDRKGPANSVGASTSVWEPPMKPPRGPCLRAVENGGYTGQVAAPAALEGFERFFNVHAVTSSPFQVPRHEPPSSRTSSDPCRLPPRPVARNLQAGKRVEELAHHRRTWEEMLDIVHHQEQSLRPGRGGPRGPADRRRTHRGRRRWPRGRGRGPQSRPRRRGTLHGGTPPGSGPRPRMPGGSFPIREVPSR